MLVNTVNARISVVGLGYIGLPTAAAFAGRGVEVIGVEINPVVVDIINRGEIHIVEPDLDEAVRIAVASGHLRATCTPEPAEVFLIAVPTPFRGDDHQPDLSYIEAAAKAVAPVLKSGDLVILESTSPVGATERMAEWLAEVRSDLTFPQQVGESSDIRIAHCPERVLPGQVMRELVSNDRIIGGMTQKCGLLAQAYYRIFVEGDCILTTARTAEMCKLAENSFRDVNIAYANELSLVCDRFGIDVWDLIRLANRHPRVSILQPGAGVGGHCIAVDPWFIVSGAPEEARLIRTAREVNDSKPAWVLKKLTDAVTEFSGRASGRRPVVAALGLAFKPDIDDLRESPALQIAATMLGRHGDDLLIVEPHVEALPAKLAGGRLTSLDEALDRADILVVLVGHRAFAGLAARHYRSDQKVIDAVGLLSRG